MKIDNDSFVVALFGNLSGIIAENGGLIRVVRKLAWSTYGAKSWRGEIPSRGAEPYGLPNFKPV